jgi:FtsH-binding integral membrane protein
MIGRRGIPRRYAHYIYGIIQSGLTCAIAAAIASYSFWADGVFVAHWLRSWFIAWVTMLPVVIFAAPFIRRWSEALTRE